MALCKICASETVPLFTKRILNKYPVQYYSCPNCGFVQTDQPFWLEEAYAEAINNTDIGLVLRNKTFSELVTAQLSILGFRRDRKYLDYGGGYGMFVRMMRDNGFNFYCYDQYCKNLYATKFVDNEPGLTQEQYEAITAFEVFEHLENPIFEIEKLLQHTDTVLFSTELSSSFQGNLENWWYIMPEHGQHIAFYHRKTLEFIAKKYGLNLYTNNHTLHLLTKRSLSSMKYRIASSYTISRLYNTFLPSKSLLIQDYELYLKQ